MPRRFRLFVFFSLDLRERGGASGKSVASSCCCCCCFSCCCRRCCCLFVACNRKRASHSGWHLKLQRRALNPSVRYKCSHVTATTAAAVAVAATGAAACASVAAAAVAPHVGLHFTRHAAVAPYVFPPCKQSAAAGSLSLSPSLSLCSAVLSHCFCIQVPVLASTHRGWPVEWPREWPESGRREPVGIAASRAT